MNCCFVIDNLWSDVKGVIYYNLLFSGVTLLGDGRNDLLGYIVYINGGNNEIGRRFGGGG